MITSLNKYQKEQIAIYRDKWIAIGLCTAPANRKLAEEGIKIAYYTASLLPPEIIWCQSPLSIGLIQMAILKRTPIKASIETSIRKSIETSIRKSIETSVRASIRASIWNCIETSVRTSIWNIVRSSVWNSIRNSIETSVRASPSFWAFIEDFEYGQHDANWLGFYQYFHDICKLETQTSKLIGLWQIAQNAGWFLPYKNICWISERHNICKLENGVIHCDGGPSISYPDGFSIWALHGVRVDKEISETPAILLDPKLILTEKNAEVRREIVRKIGIQRIVEELKSQTLDKQGSYELLSINIGDSRQRPYLKMLNPSIKTWHIEGVHPECNTVEKALNWRNSTDIRPEILT